MTQDVYRELLDVMKKRGGPYAGMDIPEFFALVEELFTPEEAALNNLMPKGPFTAEALARETGRDETEITEMLETMANKGVCTTFMIKGLRHFMGPRFMPGIFEFQFMPGTSGERDKKIAHLIWDYKKAFKAAQGKAKMVFPATRVITVDRYIPAGNVIHTYDQMASYIDKYDSIGVTTCYCRHGGFLRGEDTHEMPMEVCMQFGPSADYAVERLGGRRVSKQEALDILDLSEEAGLVHMSRNTSDDIDFVCNCDRWHCEVITGVMEQDKPALFFNSGFQPAFDAEACVACGTCVERCPPVALELTDEDAPPALDLDRCFGCAACATGCPSEAISMIAKENYPPPPKDSKELVAAMKAAYKQAAS